MTKLDGYSQEQVLAWLNAERKAHSYGPPLDCIPHGEIGNCETCPISIALNGSFVDGDGWIPVELTLLEREDPLVSPWEFLPPWEPLPWEPLPDFVRHFILDFDSGEYPELVIP